ncbi:histone deacetylation protein Rxt3-domain-containing protein [Cunninghamella echinulata]|nr:histone deacetylation protein Rxt3-domain-containing protein [Cunninghamella echinulata]
MNDKDSGMKRQHIEENVLLPHDDLLNTTKRLKLNASQEQQNKDNPLQIHSNENYISDVNNINAVQGQTNQQDQKQLVPLSQSTLTKNIPISSGNEGINKDQNTNANLESTEIQTSVPTTASTTSTTITEDEKNFQDHPTFNNIETPSLLPSSVSPIKPNPALRGQSLPPSGDLTLEYDSNNNKQKHRGYLKESSNTSSLPISNSHQRSASHPNMTSIIQTSPPPTRNPFTEQQTSQQQQSQQSITNEQLVRALTTSLPIIKDDNSSLNNNNNDNNNNNNIDNYNNTGINHKNINDIEKTNSNSSSLSRNSKLEQLPPTSPPTFNINSNIGTSTIVPPSISTFLSKTEQNETQPSTSLFTPTSSTNKSNTNTDNITTSTITTTNNNNEDKNAYSHIPYLGAALRRLSGAAGLDQLNNHQNKDAVDQVSPSEILGSALAAAVARTQHGTSTTAAAAAIGNLAVITANISNLLNNNSNNSNNENNNEYNITNGNSNNIDNNNNNNKETSTNVNLHTSAPSSQNNQKISSTTPITQHSSIPSPLSSLTTSLTTSPLSSNKPTQDKNSTSNTNTPHSNSITTMIDQAMQLGRSSQHAVLHQSVHPNFHQPPPSSSHHQHHHHTHRTLHYQQPMLKQPHDDFGKHGLINQDLMRSSTAGSSMISNSKAMTGSSTSLPPYTMGNINSMMHHSPLSVQNRLIAPIPKVIVNNEKVWKAVKSKKEVFLGFYLYRPSMLLPNLENHINGIVQIRVPARYLTYENPSVKKRAAWGTGIYTDDSDIVTMAIHSGQYVPEKYHDPELKPTDPFALAIAGKSIESGKLALKKRPIPATTYLRAAKHGDDTIPEHDVQITVRILPKLKRYTSSIQHRIKSREWGNNHDGVSLCVENVEVLKEKLDYEVEVL